MDDVKGYKTLAVLGKGGFGVVKKVQRLTDLEVFACKVIYYRDGEVLSKDTEREYITLSRLHHPHIVDYVDYQWKPDKAKLFMEYCSGGDLQQLIKKNERLNSAIPETKVWSVLSQLASALLYCHYGIRTTSEGNLPPTVALNEWDPIIHRDIKPANVMVCSDNNDTIVVKLADFGLSRIMDGDSMPTTYAGTHQYQPPEISRSNSEGILWTKKSDIFSLGCTLYAMCTGKAPFPWRMEESEGFEEIPVSFSEKLRKCITLCLAFHSEKRPDAFDLLRLIQQMRSDPATREMMPVVDEPVMKNHKGKIHESGGKNNERDDGENIGRTVPKRNIVIEGRSEKTMVPANKTSFSRIPSKAARLATEYWANGKDDLQSPMESKDLPVATQPSQPEASDTPEDLKNHPQGVDTSNRSLIPQERPRSPILPPRVSRWSSTTQPVTRSPFFCTFSHCLYSQRESAGFRTSNALKDHLVRVHGLPRNADEIIFSAQKENNAKEQREVLVIERDAQQGATDQDEVAMSEPESLGYIEPPVSDSTVTPGPQNPSLIDGRLSEETSENKPEAKLNRRATGARAKHPARVRSESLPLHEFSPETVDSLVQKRPQNQKSGVTIPKKTDRVLEGITEANLAPIYLKGLFSVSTTSTKPLKSICTEILRVLQLFYISYKQIEGGFGCRYSLAQDQLRYQREFEAFIANKSRRMNAVSANTIVTAPHLPIRIPGPGDQAEVEDRMLVFEVLIVKVPLVSIHGIQFKKIRGKTWLYKKVAGKTLDELRL